MSTSVDDETILEVLRSNDDPRVSTTEVANQLPITRGRTRTRLQQLVEDDKLNRAKEGVNVVWWLPERADEVETESAEATAGTETEEPEEPPAETDATATGEEGPDEADAEADAGDTAEGTAGAEPEETEPESAEAAEADARREEEEASEEATESAAVPEVEDGDGEEADADAEGVGVPTDTDETAQAPTAGAAGEDEVQVESVESLEGDRTPDAETDVSAATRAGQPEPAPDDEGLRALAALAVLLAAIVLLRKLFGGDE